MTDRDDPLVLADGLPYDGGLDDPALVAALVATEQAEDGDEQQDPDDYSEHGTRHPFETPPEFATSAATREQSAVRSLSSLSGSVFTDN